MRTFHWFGDSWVYGEPNLDHPNVVGHRALADLLIKLLKDRNYEPK